MRKIFVIAAMLFCMNAQSLVVLQYHHISDKTPGATSTSPELFAQHLQFIKANKFKVISVLALKELLLIGEKLPDRTLVITFDDGYRSIYSNAFPLLKKYQFPFTVFINSKAHDEKNTLFASWSELKDMSKNGAVIANHTDSHPHLIRNYRNARIDAWRESRFREISFAENRIKTMIGKSYKLFAYPYGEYDSALVKKLSNQGYLAFTQQSGPVDSSMSMQLIPRFPMGGRYGAMSELPIKLQSIPFPRLKVLVTDGKGKVLPEPELPMGVKTPELQLATPLARFIQGFNCYASGQGLIESRLHTSTLVARANSPLPVGRSRYNCTAKAGGGRYYWYSQLFILRSADGSWYRE